MDDAALVARARRGSREAFVSLVSKYEERLYRSAYGLLGNEQDAADAFQETLLAAYRNIASLRQPQFFGTWITRILLNRCYDILRRRRKELPSGCVIDDVSVGSSRIDEATTIDVLREVSRLEEPYRTLVVLRYFNDLSISQMAGILKCPVGTVKSRLHEARARLRTALADHLGGGR